jgi:hypothetical protein
MVTTVDVEDREPERTQMSQRLKTFTLLRRFGLAGSASEAAFPAPERRLDDAEALAQMALADAADASLLRLVLCAASATLVLALASSLL